MSANAVIAGNAGNEAKNSGEHIGKDGISALFSLPAITAFPALPAFSWSLW